MNKILAILILLALVAGCRASNDEIIAETQKCERAGMQAVFVSNALGSIGMIECRPRLVECTEEK